MDLQEEFKRFDRMQREEKIRKYLEEINKSVKSLEKMGINKQYIINKLQEKP